MKRSLQSSRTSRGERRDRAGSGKRDLRGSARQELLLTIIMRSTIDRTMPDPTPLNKQLWRDYAMSLGMISLSMAAERALKSFRHVAPVAANDSLFSIVVFCRSFPLIPWTGRS